MKTHAESPILTVIDSILLLANVRGLNVEPFLTKTAFTRCRKRILRRYGVDFAGPPSLFAHELLVCRGGDLQLWPVDDYIENNFYPQPVDIERAA